MKINLDVLSRNFVIAEPVAFRLPNTAEPECAYCGSRFTADWPGYEDVNDAGRLDAGGGPQRAIIVTLQS